MSRLTIHSSLKNHGVEEEVEEMFDMGRDTLDLPLEEKSKFEQGNQGFSFGSVLIQSIILPSIHDRLIPLQIQRGGRAVH